MQYICLGYFKPRYWISGVINLPNRKPTLQLLEVMLRFDYDDLPAAVNSARQLLRL
ncbi:MAG TPA: hypothetical protein VIX17_26755 [Pyrinomonadaceae bacterium]|jgi:hypothetical protein